MSKLLEQLKLHEGVRTHFYRCSSGLATIGVGRCIEPGSLGLSDDEILYLLQNDVGRCKRELLAFSWFIDLDSVRQDAMINLCFNLGFSRLSLFTNALSAMAEANYERAAMEFLDSKWARQVGKRSEDVAHMIRTGTYPN
jgi:lysozyme